MIRELLLSSQTPTTKNTALETFRLDAIGGLSQPTKQLPCKHFYDERGSDLFDQICELDEYYLTRAELAIMEEHAAEMGEAIGPGVMLVEYGSGSSLKTRILLENLPEPVAYVPVDISGDYLHQVAESLSDDFPEIEILPVCADFTEEFSLPQSRHTPTHTAVYFPGSTIGNLKPQAAVQLLQQIARLCGSGGGLLLGIDLQKDPAVIHAAYNDTAGITEQFNLNLLHRMNRELDADFDIDQFAHRAVYNEQAGRVEISIVSKTKQTASIGEAEFQFADGEEILTEYSHKYAIDDFAELTSAAGLTLRRAWLDEDAYFAVLHLVVA